MGINSIMSMSGRIGVEVKAFDVVLYCAEKWIVGWVKGSIALIVNGKESRVVLLEMLEPVSAEENQIGGVVICREQK